MKKPSVILVLWALVSLTVGALVQPVIIAQGAAPTPIPGVSGRLCFNCLPGEVVVIKIRWLSIDANPTWTEWASRNATPPHECCHNGNICVDASMDWLSYQKLEWQAFDDQGRLIVSGDMPLPQGWKENHNKVQWDLIANLCEPAPTPIATEEAISSQSQSYATLTIEAAGSLQFGPVYDNGLSIVGSGALAGDINDSYQTACRVVMQNLSVGQMVEGILEVGSEGEQFTVSYSGLLEFTSGSSPYGPAIARLMTSGQVTAASGAYAHLLGAAFDLNGYGLIGYPIPVKGSVRLFPAR